MAFAAPGGFAPGAGSLAVRGTNLYISSTCQGGVQRLPIRVLLDDSRPAAERAQRIVTVDAAQEPLESLKGITFNRWDRDDPWIYAGDPFALQLIRVHSRSGRREVLSTDARLFNFTVATAFLPPRRRGGPNPLVTASDQEYRWSATNAALGGVDAFQRRSSWRSTGRGDDGRAVARTGLAVQRVGDPVKTQRALSPGWPSVARSLARDGAQSGQLNPWRVPRALTARRNWRASRRLWCCASCVELPLACSSDGQPSSRAPRVCACRAPRRRWRASVVDVACAARATSIAALATSDSSERRVACLARCSRHRVDAPRAGSL